MSLLHEHMGGVWRLFISLVQHRVDDVVDCAMCGHFPCDGFHIGTHCEWIVS